MPPLPAKPFAGTALDPWTPPGAFLSRRHTLRLLKKALAKTTSIEEALTFLQFNFPEIVDRLFDPYLPQQLEDLTKQLKIQIARNE